MDQSHTGHQLESPAEINKLESDPKKAKVLRWKLELENAEKVFQKYHKSVDVILERYRDDRGEMPSEMRRYNALWSMKETLKPLLFAESPVPYVEREHDDDDHAGRDAAIVLQRLLTGKAGSDRFYDALSEAVDDYVLLGRGMTWVTYAPEFALRDSEVPEYVADEDDIPEDEYAEPDEKGDRPKYKAEKDERGTYYRKKIEYKASETCLVESVNAKDLLHGPATRWRHVPWVARRVPMLRTEAIKRFGKRIGSKLPLAAKEAANPRHKAPNTDDFLGQFSRAVVWEIWDKVNKKVVWICPDYTDEVLDEKDDPLKLESFFPCSKPLFGTMTNDTIIPVPDYVEWQDIAMELDDITHRISMLTSALRVVGVYSQEFGVELGQLLEKNATQNKMVPVSNWAMFAEKGGLKGAVDFFPLDQVIQTLDKLYEVRGRLVQELYEITGISDIVRGASDPRETASAQKLKGQFANARLTSRQKLVARHARETLSILAEVACTLYSDETIMRLSGAPQIFKTEAGEFDYVRWKAAMALLRDEPMRTLRVKIDTESLAESTIMADREEATQFLQAIGSYMQQAVAMLQMAPNMGNVLGKMMLFAVRKYKPGRGMESDIDSAIKQLAKTGLGQPMDEQGAGGEAGMNSLEQQVEMDKNAVAREKLQIERDRLQLERDKIAWQQQKETHEAKMREQDVGIKGYKAKEDVRIADRQIDVQVQGQQQQVALQAQEQQLSAQQAEREMQHEQAMGQADLQIRHAEHVASREDAAADRDMRSQEFAASRHDAAAERQERQVDRKVAQRNADADRKVKVTQAKAKATKPKPKA